MRAAVSIASNIAEGSGRGTQKDFRQFVMIARGSNYELQTQIFIAARMPLADKAKIGKAEKLFNNEVGQMLNGLAAFLVAAKRTTNNE